tara:strand:+ start:334 stop:678 length:345 start_codon:yes stop_codon:yes gene_type:complete
MPQFTGYANPLAQRLSTPTGMAGPSRLEVGPKTSGFNNMGNKQPWVGLRDPGQMPIDMQRAALGDGRLQQRFDAGGQIPPAKYGAPQRPAPMKGRVRNVQRFGGGGMTPRNGLR